MRCTARGVPAEQFGWAKRKRAHHREHDVRWWARRFAPVPTRQSLPRQRLARFQELFEFRILLFEALGNALFAPFATCAGGLLDQLPDIVPQNRDAIVQFRQRQKAFIFHGAFSAGAGTGELSAAVSRGLSPCGMAPAKLS